MDVVKWMLDSDPALRWQVERDVLGAPEQVWQATRARVATEGFGKALLDRQDPDGRWAAGAHFPTQIRFEAHAEDPEAQPWLATSWALKMLREWGVEPGVMRDTAERLATSCRWEYDDLPFWQGEVDCCINSFTLASGAWLGVDVSHLVTWFDQHRMADGGWNCEWEDGSTRSSFHSTINSLIGLLEYQEYTGISTRQVRTPGEEYLLERALLRRAATGEEHPWATVLEYPLRWRYSILRALDYFRAATLADQVPADPRLDEAIRVLRAKRQPDGRWLQERRDPGAVWFYEDVPAGEPSKWLTFFATRVLTWADSI